MNSSPEISDSVHSRSPTMVGLISKVLGLPVMESVLVPINNEILNQLERDAQFGRNTIRHIMLALGNGFDPIQAMKQNIPSMETYNTVDVYRRLENYTEHRERFEEFCEKQRESLLNLQRDIAALCGDNRDTINAWFQQHHIDGMSTKEISDRLVDLSADNILALQRQSVLLSHLENCIEMFRCCEDMEYLLAWRNCIITTENIYNVSTLNLLSYIHDKLLTQVRFVCLRLLHDLRQAVRFDMYYETLLYPANVMQSVAITLAFLPEYIASNKMQGNCNDFDIVDYLASEHISMHRKGVIDIDLYTLECWKNCLGESPPN